MSDLARLVLDELAGDPVALARLRELVADDRDRNPPTSPAFTVATLAVELGRSERSIRAAIARGELEAVKRGRGWVVSADAVASWARAPADPAPASSRRRLQSRQRPGSGPMSRALKS